MKSGVISTSWRAAFRNKTAVRSDRGPSSPQRRQHFDQSMTRVKNVVDQQNFAVGDVEHHLRVDGQRSRSRAVAIAARLQHSDAQRHRQQANQVGQQHNAPGQHAHDRQRPVRVSAVDLVRHADHAVVELGGGQQCLHIPKPLCTSSFRAFGRPPGRRLRHFNAKRAKGMRNAAYTA